MAQDKEKGNILVRTFREFGEDDCPRMAAALAYYVVFALPPLLVLMLLVTGLLMDPAQVESWIEGQMPPGTSQQLSSMVESASERLAAGSTMAWILGLAGLLFSATGAFAQLQKALNTAWGVEQDPEEKGKRKILRMVTKRILSLGMIVVMAFLIIVAMSISGIISAFSGRIAQLFTPLGVSETAGQVLAWMSDAIVSLLVLTLIFSAMFMVLPDVKTRWKDIRLGAFVTAVLFVVGKMVIGWYIGRSNPGEAFGVAGAFAVILIFAYYAAMIVLLGAEFTEVWARRYGKDIRPADYAVKVFREKRHIREDEPYDEPARPSSSSKARAPSSSTRAADSGPDRPRRRE